MQQSQSHLTLQPATNEQTSNRKDHKQAGEQTVLLHVTGNYYFGQKTILNHHSCRFRRVLFFQNFYHSYLSQIVSSLLCSYKQKMVFPFGRQIRQSNIYPTKSDSCFDSSLLSLALRAFPIISTIYIISVDIMAFSIANQNQYHRIMRTTYLRGNIATRQLPPIAKQPAPKANLKNIIELTEQNQNNPTPVEDHPQLSPQNESTPSKFACIKKCLNCFRLLWTLMGNSSHNMHLQIDDQDLPKTIAKIISNKQHCHIVLPPQKQNRKVLVLDLDETLVFSSFNKPNKYDCESEVLFNGRPTKIYTIKRFGLDSFLFEMSKLFEIVVFTASQKMYADRILNLIDPKSRISHRLYRQHCLIINKTYYLKNMQVLGRNMKEVIVVDDNKITGLLQPDNFYKIEPFRGNEKDRYLYRLGDFLRHIHQKNEILPISERRTQFEEIEIQLKDQTASVKPERSSKAKRDRKSKKFCVEFGTTTTTATLTTEEQKQCEMEAETTASELIKSM